MDDLDRLFRRLVQNIRNGYPEYLTRPFEVSELVQNLVPYRHNRRELEIETNGDYELAICRLLMGERDYATVDDTVREGIRREVETPNPNTAIFREYAASRVTLAPDALRRFDVLATGATASVAGGGSEPMHATPVVNPYPRTPINTRVPGAQSPPPQSPSAPFPPPPPPPAPASPPQAPRMPVSAPTPSAPQAAQDRQGQPTAPQPRQSTAAGSGGCRYCGGALPQGRRVVFCPHCGQNLTIQRCPACASELELGWKFCITCGRGVSAT
ncbi:MAG: zinc ribbon domain-containing protein [Gemmatimonadota bacterium]|nr:zinc ribbon domain-containing protein [Gemmatimonadota bacterium]